MTGIRRHVHRTFGTVTLVLLLGAQLQGPSAWAQSAGQDGERAPSPKIGAMAADLLIARPVGAAILVAGTAAFLVSLPFTVISGSVQDAGDALVAAPAQETLGRCLGCTSIRRR